MFSKKTIVVGVSFFLALAFGTPESSLYLCELVEQATHGFLILQPVIEIPVIAQWVFVAVILVVGMDGLDLYLRANYSPQVMGAGLKHPYSFNGNMTELNGFGIIGAGGSAAPIPHDGPHVLMNPLTHVHRIGEHVVFEAVVTENRPLEETPIEIKRFVRSKRGGLWGVKTTGAGWFTSQELALNKTFELQEGKYTATVSTSNFITEDAKLADKYDKLLQLTENEGAGLSDMLSTMSQIGEKHLDPSEKGFLKKYITK